MEENIKNKFIKGVLWGVIEKFATLATGFIITLVLARILTPADYGLVNMIYIFTVLGTVLLDGGFGQALIQRKNVTRLDASSVFYINLTLSIIIYLVLYFTAPLIASFYKQPSLLLISRVVFTTIPISALCIVQHNLLTKELKVKELTYVSILSSLVSGIIGIWLAYCGFGVWSLVYQTVILQIVRTIALWWFSDWRPCLSFSIKFIRSIWSFSMNLLGVFTLASVFQNIYTLIIGRLYNVNEVGYYNQAFRMQSVASNAIMSSIQRVAFPAFAKFQDDYQTLQRTYKRVMLMTMYVYFPFMMSLIVVSTELFDVLLTSKWLPSVPMFCLLCVAESLYPLNNINSSVLKAVGKGHDYLVLNIVNYILIIICILVTYRFGIIALLGGYAVSSILRSLISMTVCGREIKYSIYAQLRDLVPVFLITLLTCLAVFFITKLPYSEIIRLIISIFTGCVTFIILNVVTKSQLINELKALKK
jgi:polysaccharide biosynthesis protein